MKRREVLMGLPAAALAASAQTKPEAKKAFAAPTPAQLAADRHLLAMMVILMTKSGSTFPMIDVVTKNTQAQATAVNPLFKRIDPNVYTQVQLQLKAPGGLLASAIQNHQVQLAAVESALGYPDNQCPFTVNIAKVVAALVP
jgi:hypothetical protein